MAKLSANGRRQLVEVTRELTAEQLQRDYDRYQASFTPDYVPGSVESLTVWERVTRRLMSDGKILEKRDVRFRPSVNATWEDPKGRLHSYGWKVHAKLKAGLSAADFARIYAQPRKDGSASSWTVTVSSTLQVA